MSALELDLEVKTSKEQDLQIAKYTINYTIANIAKQLKISLETVQGTILANPKGLTKEEIRAYYGEENSIKLDEISALSLELLAAVTIKGEDGII